MRIDALDIKKLLAFQLVARTGNLRQAALRVNQTIPAISTKIRRLEEDLGVKLFQRLPNKLILTEKGEKFLTEIDAVITRGEQAIAAMAEPDSLNGRLNVSVGSDHFWYFAPRISDYLTKFPEVELRLQVYRASDALQALMRGELDISLGIFPNLSPSLECEVATESGLSLVCLKGDALLRRHPPTLSEIARRRLIVLPSHAETRKLIDQAMSDHSVTAKSIIEVSNCSAASTFVESGVGVGIVHSLCIGHSHSDAVQWVDLSQHFGKVAFSVVCRRGARRALIVDELIKYIVK